MAFNIIFYDEVVSTNGTAKQLAELGAEEWTVVSAGHQSGGKGRSGKWWHSEKGDNAMFSVILKPKAVSQITLAAGLAVCCVLENLTRLDVKIKWPNDVLLNGKKVCGILAESKLDGPIVKYVVLGIGINVNAKIFEGELKEKATSIYIESGVMHDVRSITNEALCQLSNTLEKECLMAEYKKRCVNINRHVRVIQNGAELLGFCEDITDDGKIALLTENNERVYIESNEVSVRGMTGYF